MRWTEGGVRGAGAAACIARGGRGVDREGPKAHSSKAPPADPARASRVSDDVARLLSLPDFLGLAWPLFLFPLRAIHRTLSSARARSAISLRSALRSAARASLRARTYPPPASPANHLHARSVRVYATDANSPRYRACGRQAMRTRPWRSARARQAFASAISLAFDACHQRPTEFSHRRVSQSQRLSGSPARRALRPPRSPTRPAGRLSGFALESSAVETIPAPLSDARRTR